MSGRPTLPAGRELAQWLREGGKPGCAPRSALWLYRWQAFWLEQHYALLRRTGYGAQSFPHSEGEGLIFILGFWRSGTTLLHELLARAPGCGAPQTWQCMDPSALLMGGRRRDRSASTQRPMDKVMVSDSSPQEDEFALMAMGIPSVYRGFLDPRRLPDLTPLLEQSYWEATSPGWEETLECFLSWCQERDRPRMVLKSPNHLFRYRASISRYPLAQFVWIVRSPGEVWRSNLRMWRAMIGRYGLWKGEGSELETFLLRALESYANLLEELYQEGAFLNHHVISYEGLVASPGAVLSPLADHLGLGPWDTWGPSLISLIHSESAKKAPSADADAPVELLARLEAMHHDILSQGEHPRDASILPPPII